MLTIAVFQEDLALVNRLLKAGAQPDHEVNYNRSPLGKAVTKPIPGIVEALVVNGANPNGIEGEEGRPLLYALRANQYESAAILLKHKANPRYLPEMEAWIIAWMAGSREKYQTDPSWQEVVTLLVKDNFKFDF